jgi:hypothetical protein
MLRFVLRYLLWFLILAKNYVAGGFQVWSCGNNTWGQIGDGTVASRNVPVNVINNSSGAIKKLMCFGGAPLTTYVLLEDGTIYNWDDVTFMDYTGNISRIMHKGVKYIDKDKSQGSISIPKNGKLNDIIVPTSNVYFSQGFGVYVPSEWKQKSIIPCFYKSKKEMQNDIDNKIWIGKKVQILFPIEIEGKKNDYNFEFTVNGTY